MRIAGLACAASLFLAATLAAQMPEWFTVRDRDGNEYFMDRNGKIWTSGSPDFDYKPASIEGIEYFTEQGIELIKRHHKAEGLTLLKSVLALPVSNKLIYDAQVKATRALQALQRREGTRFDAINAKASLALYRVGTDITVMNDRMHWTIRIPNAVTVIKRTDRERHGYAYQGVLLGVVFDKRPPEVQGHAPRYDALVAIDGERFPFELGSVKRLEENWANNLGGAERERHVEHRAPDRVIYHCRDKVPGDYSWYEGLYVNGRYGIIVRMIMESGAYARNGNKLLAVLKDFRN